MITSLIAALLLSQAGTCKTGAICTAYGIKPPAVATAAMPACNTSSRGTTLRNGTLNCLQYCNGTAWSCVATAINGVDGWTYNGAGTAIVPNASALQVNLGAAGAGLFVEQATPGILRYPSAPQKTINFQGGVFIELYAGIGGAVSLANDTSFSGSLSLLLYTDDSGTTGSRTVNQVRGKNAFAAAATAITITNSYTTTASQIVCTVETADATCKSVVCAPAAGSFTATVNAACTATTKLGWTVLK